jgi:cobalt-zinc-cadmium efflux system membrane fusion protein
MLPQVEATPILVVDDDEVLGQVLTRVLTRDGRSIIPATTMAQALELARRHRPRLALLDLCLPDGDGTDLARELQAEYPDIPLILMTAYPLRLREHPELSERFTRVLTKPLNLQELRQAVDAALTEGAAPAPSRSRVLPVDVHPAEARTPVLSSVAVVREPVMAAESGSPYLKWAGFALAALAILVVLIIVPPIFGLPGLQALWTAAPKREIVESKPSLNVELVKDQPNTLFVGEAVQQSLGIRQGKMENITVAEVPKRPRQLVVPGSTALDDTKLSRVRTRFNAEVIDILKVLSDLNQPPSAQNPMREVLPGDEIEKGKTLAVVWSTDVGSKKSDLVDALVQLKRDKDRLERLIEGAKKGNVPEDTLNQGRRDVAADENAVARAERTLRTWNIPDKEIKEVFEEADQVYQRLGQHDREKERQWARSEIVAPRTGTIVERNIGLGEFVADNTLPLFQIADVDRLLVIANPAESELPELLRLKKERGQLYWTIHTAGLPPEGVTAPISEVSYFIDPNQHTAVVKGFIDNPKNRLRAGQLATAAIDLPAPEHTVEIPISALVEDGKQSIVFVQKDPTKPHFTMKRVIVTHRFAKTAYVLSDFSDLKRERRIRTSAEKDQGLLEPEPLTEGERVITSGALELKAALEDKESAAAEK